MIDVILYKRESHIVGFRMSGHAGYADHGNDIVCASASVLAINTVNSIETFTEDQVKLVFDETGMIDLKVEESVSASSQLLLNAFELGVTSIYEEYKHDYINIKFEEV